MPGKPQDVSFTLEAHCESIPRELADLAVMVRDDPNSSLQVKLLATIALRQMVIFNQLVASLEFGSVNIVVKEKDIHTEYR